MLRYLNMFVMIGIALICVSLAGIASGQKMQIEPGQSMDMTAILIYLGTGVLMIINGVLSVKTAPIPPPPVQKK
jgi:hypothetical protein